MSPAKLEDTRSTYQNSTAFLHIRNEQYKYEMKNSNTKNNKIFRNTLNKVSTRLIH